MSVFINPKGYPQPIGMPDWFFTVDGLSAQVTHLHHRFFVIILRSIFRFHKMALIFSNLTHLQANKQQTSTPRAWGTVYHRPALRIYSYVDRGSRKVHLSITLRQIGIAQPRYVCCSQTF